MAYEPCGRLDNVSGNTIFTLEDLDSYEMSTTYDDADQILTTTEISPNGEESITSLMTYDYDHAGRQNRSTIRINNLPSEILTQQTYTAKDQVAQLSLGGGLQHINYSYLPNRYLSSINNPLSMGNDLWAMDIAYDNELTSTPGVGGFELNDGNISSIRWRVKDGQHLAYEYGYDFLKRLQFADFYDSVSTNDGDFFDLLQLS